MYGPVVPVRLCRASPGRKSRDGIVAAKPYAGRRAACALRPAVTPRRRPRRGEARLKPPAPVVPVDTLTLVETPEGISLRLRAAGMMPRAAAWAIDFALRMVVVWFVSLLLAVLGDLGVAIYLIVLFCLFWLYPVLFEVLMDGQTPGKRAVGLRVVNANGTPVGWVPSIVRNLMRTVDMLPVCYGFGLVAGLVDAHSRRFGDMVADTLVVHVEHHHGHHSAPAVPAVQSPLLLPAAEQGSIVAFAERAKQLTPERQQELANLLPQLTQARGAVAVQRLLGMASSFLGRH